MAVGVQIGLQIIRFQPRSDDIFIDLVAAGTQDMVTYKQGPVRRIRFEERLDLDVRPLSLWCRGVKGSHAERTEINPIGRTWKDHVFMQLLLEPVAPLSCLAPLS